MRHPNILDPAQTALVIIDMQQSFAPAMAAFDEAAIKIAKLATAARLLGLPIIVTEHYPKGLGHTVESVRAALPADQPIVEKTAFSCCGAQAFIDQLTAAGARQALLCGLEAHVCVCQTALDLLARGLQVHVVTDAVVSRSLDNRAAGLSKMQHSGAIASTMEMALFELLRDAKHPQFKAIHQLLK